AKLIVRKSRWTHRIASSSDARASGTRYALTIRQASRVPTRRDLSLAQCIAGCPPPFVADLSTHCIAHVLCGPHAVAPCCRPPPSGLAPGHPYLPKCVAAHADRPARRFHGPK